MVTSIKATKVGDMERSQPQSLFCQSAAIYYLKDMVLFLDLASLKMSLKTFFPSSEEITRLQLPDMSCTVSESTALLKVNIIFFRVMFRPWIKNQPYIELLIIY